MTIIGGHNPLAMAQSAVPVQGNNSKKFFFCKGVAKCCASLNSGVIFDGVTIPTTVVVTNGSTKTINKVSIKLVQVATWTADGAGGAHSQS
jgi:hypothetical protein